MWNLLDNAVKYSPACKTVWAEALSQNGSVAIRGRDQGLGIAPDEQKRIFKKFVRAGSARMAGATGQAEELHLISAPASRNDFSGLVLDQLDPAACLKHLKAILSPHPYDLEPVEPVIEFQQAKYRFTDPVDALAGIDSRSDLLKMDWYKFENLMRQLFEAMGLEVHVTQSSRDEGIDAVAYNKADIVHRSEILIQAKRYSNCVPANDVRALAGSVEEKRATAGVLVTTAWVSPETKAFAARNNRLSIIEGGELKHLLAEHLNLDVRIDLGRHPRRATSAAACGATASGSSS